MHQFRDLTFFGNFTFLDELYRVRSTDDACMEAKLRVVVSATDNEEVPPGGIQPPEPDTYRLVGKFMGDERLTSTRALTGDCHLDFVVGCNIQDTLFLLCGVPQVLRGEALKDLLPLGKRRCAQTSWTLEAQVEMLHLPESDETFPMKIHIERRQQHFFVRRVELELPSQVCQSWWEQTCLMLRQCEAGITDTSPV